MRDQDVRFSGGKHRLRRFALKISNNPARHVLNVERTFAQIRDVLAQMPEPDREILTLRYALDYNTNEIADLLAINATAVHMRLSRARQRLADRLRAQGVGQLP